MRSRLIAGVAALVLVVAGLLLPASPASADCSHPNHPNEYSGGGISFGRDGTKIRSGPHSGCPVRGTALPGDPIDVHCAVLNEHTNFNVWVFVRDLRTGVSGWAHENTLRVEGVFRAVHACNADGFVAVH